MQILKALAEGELPETAPEVVTTDIIDWGNVWNTILNWMLTTGIKIVIALVLLLITFKVVDFSAKKIYNALHKKGVDETIIRVSTNATRILLKLVIIACLVGYVGIETASISAVVASIGVGISLAVQGTLANFAGGVIILLMRPFRIGDFITSNGESGTVEDIHLFYTDIVTPDNRMVMIPNGSLANGVIVNVTAKDTRRCEVIVSVAYNTDLDLAKQVIKEVAESCEFTLPEPAVFVSVKEYGESSINIVCRAWCNKKDYWNLYFYIMNELKKALDKHNIEIPFNQLDVHFDGEPVPVEKPALPPVEEKEQEEKEIPEVK